ncbi:DNA double-strand break repair nuclease NurA [Oceanithermus sp.]
MKPRLRLDVWSPEYTAPPAQLVQQETGLQAEPLAADGAWEAKSRALDWSGPLFFVDGVFRTDALLFLGEVPALLVSVAVGAVGLLEGGAVYDQESFLVRRYLVAPPGVWPEARLEVSAGLVYELVEVEGELEELRSAAMERRGSLEMGLGEGVLARYPEALVLHDGPLHRLPVSESARRLGFAKTHHRSYLSPEYAGLLAELAAGARTPVFTFDRGERRFYSWYLRLPLEPEKPYAAAAALLRVETAAPEAEALRLADVSLSVFPRLASQPFRDPRAPQNLVPVGALERELGRRLGSAPLIRRRLLEYIRREAV